MQAEANILERVAQAYVAHRWARLLCVLGVLSAALLLFLLSGGFPPFAWRLLAQALPQISVLEAAHGQVALLALSGLILLSVTLLLAWGALFWLSWRMLAYWRYERQELRNFAADAAEAQYLAEDEETTYPTRSNLARRHGIYPLSPSAPEDLDDEDPYQDAPDDEYNEYDEPEDGEEDEISLYQDGDEDEAFWEEQSTVPVPAPHPRRGQAAPLHSQTGGAYPRRGQAAPLHAQTEGAYPRRGQAAPLHAQTEDAYRTSVNVAPVLAPGVGGGRVQSMASGAGGGRAQPTAPGAIYDQRIVEYSGPGTRLDDIKHSSYGRIVPFAPTSAVDVHSHPATGLYGRVPLPSVVTTTPEPAALHLTTQLIVSTGLDVGLKRKDKPNEDSLLALQNTRVLRGCSSPVGLFVVADGMGGHANGQEASRLVIQSLSKTVVPSIIYGPTDDNYAELLSEGVHHANLEVYQRNRQEQVNMGSTIAAALVVDTTAYVVNAGDSRVYLYRASSGLSQVTRDHSTVARLVETGVIQPDEIYTHPRRNEIYRSLGHHPSEDLDKFILALQPEDLLLICSDGLWEMVRDSQIQQVIASTLPQPTRISAALVQAALEGGGKDNISVIVVYVKAVEATQTAWAG